MRISKVKIDTVSKMSRLESCIPVNIPKSSKSDLKIAKNKVEY